MKVLGIDPGYERLGVAVIEANPSTTLGTKKPQLVFSECFKTSAKDQHPVRLTQIHEEIERVIKKYKPTHLGIETLFFNKNVKTAIKVAEARGIILALAQKNNLKVSELSPQAVKIAVTGYGKSDKTAIMKMVPLLVEIKPLDPARGKKNSTMLDDEFDAIAAGLCVLAGTVN